jgi:hypothetical protein
LYAKEIRVQTTINDSGWRSVMDEVFPGQEMAQMDWFSGLLVIPTGEVVEYGYDFELSTYERYILLEIENGILTKRREYSLDEYQDFNRRQFEAFRKSDEYKKSGYELEERYNRHSDTDFIKHLLQSLVIEHTTKFLVE